MIMNEDDNIMGNIKYYSYNSNNNKKIMISPYYIFSSLLIVDEIF